MKLSIFLPGPIHNCPCQSECGKAERAIFRVPTMIVAWVRIFLSCMHLSVQVSFHKRLKSYRFNFLTSVGFSSSNHEPCNECTMLIVPNSAYSKPVYFRQPPHDRERDERHSFREMYASSTWFKILDCAGLFYYTFNLKGSYPSSYIKFLTCIGQ